jgi:hypothetical protein
MKFIQIVLLILVSVLFTACPSAKQINKEVSELSKAKDTISAKPPFKYNYVRVFKRFRMDLSRSVLHAECKYDTNGNEIERHIFNFSNDTIYTFEYNNKNLKIAGKWAGHLMDFKNLDNELGKHRIGVIKYEYDANSNLIAETKYDSSNAVVEFNKFTYNNNSIIETTTFNISLDSLYHVTKYKNDIKGNHSEAFVYDCKDLNNIQPDNWNMRLEFKYDEKNNLVEKNEYPKNENKIEYHTYIYNEKNQLVNEKWSNNYDGIVIFNTINYNEHGLPSEVGTNNRNNREFNFNEKFDNPLLFLYEYH